MFCAYPQNFASLIVGSLARRAVLPEEGSEHTSIVQDLDLLARGVCQGVSGLE